ncbi:hypothetical protein [Escherichia coli]|uniref:hypothetical protein n=1 Tax=Escherichia coli TaxID=562 RepID=UPI001E37E0E5|nr:hypothetical protein [Escherichia coli]
MGNNASFHCHNGNGYSSDIDRAHVYTLEAAQKAWNCGRDIDQPVCADSVDAMAVWHVDCQYIPTESLIESDCTAYVAYKKGSWNGNDVYWLQHGGLPTDDFSKATIFSVANKNEPGIVWCWHRWKQSLFCIIPALAPPGIAVFRGRNGKNVVVSATKTICVLQTRLTMLVGYTNVENYIPLRQRR